VKKVFILDTNILLIDPNSIFKFDDNDVVIPISVIEEIDTFKKDQSETGRNAREVSRILDRVRKRGTLSSGVPLFEKSENNALVFVYLSQDMDRLPKVLGDNTDNHILAVALALKDKFQDKRKVTIITKDSNLRIKADVFGISSEDFEADKVDVSHMYSGIQKFHLESKDIETIEEEGSVVISDSQLLPNQFVVIEEESHQEKKACGYFDEKTKKVKKIDIRSDNVWGIVPRNTEQNLAMWALLNEDIKLVTLTGGAGTGKTLLAIAAGLSMTTDEDVYNRLLISRPIFPLGKDVGFLPGDLDEKLNPWMQPVFDSLDFLLGGGVSSKQKKFSKSYHELINQGMLAVEPLTYIRGRSLPHSYFIVDESQNLTPHEIKTIITRAGDGTKVVFTGDPFQIDNPYVDSTNNGLTYLVERFKKSSISAHVTLNQGERSELASLAAEFL